MVAVQSRLHEATAAAADSSGDAKQAARKSAVQAKLIEDLKRRADSEAKTNADNLQQMQNHLQDIGELETQWGIKCAELEAAREADRVAFEAERAAWKAGNATANHQRIIEKKEFSSMADQRAKRSANQKLKRLKKKYSIRAVKTGETAQNIKDYKKDWADEIEMHMKVRRGMKPAQILAAVETLHERLLVPNIADNDDAIRSSAMSTAERKRASRAKAALKKAVESGQDTDDLDRLVSDYLLGEDRFSKVAPAHHLEAIRKEGAANLARNLAEYQDTSRCLYFKEMCSLSDARYELIRGMMSKRYNPDTGAFDPLILHGTLIEAWPSVWRVKKKATDLLDNMRIHESKDGKRSHLWTCHREWSLTWRVTSRRAD